MHLQKRSADAVAIKLNNGCVKLNLPNGKVVDILTDVLDEISNCIQSDNSQPESGGYVVGYQHQITKNIVLESLSTPFALDIRSPVRFVMKDPQHKFFLLKSKRRKSYYMGVWHTYPQSLPVPSSIDWKDWRRTLMVDKTACDFVFFIIAGTLGMRVWVGNRKNKSIVEINESPKVDGIYK